MVVSLARTVTSVTETRYMCVRVATAASEALPQRTRELSNENLDLILQIVIVQAAKDAVLNIALIIGMNSDQNATSIQEKEVIMTEVVRDRVANASLDPDQGGVTFHLSLKFISFNFFPLPFNFNNSHFSNFFQ